MQEVEPGSLVVWNPRDLNLIFSDNFALKLSDEVPIRGIVRRVDGQIALMAYMQQSGERAQIPVKLSELYPAGVCNVAE